MLLLAELKSWTCTTQNGHKHRTAFLPARGSASQLASCTPPGPQVLEACCQCQHSHDLRGDSNVKASLTALPTLLWALAHSDAAQEPAAAQGSRNRTCDRCSSETDSKQGSTTDQGCRWEPAQKLLTRRSSSSRGSSSARVSPASTVL